MSNVELRERVHLVVDALQEDQLRAIYDLLEAFRNDANASLSKRATTLAEKQVLLAQTVRLMIAHPLSAAAPRLTRDDLHERR